MKLAISIPDPVFEAAERLARERGVPRSQLYAEALKDYLDRHGSDSVTAHLDRVHGENRDTLDEAFTRAQLASLDHETW